MIIEDMNDFVSCFGRFIAARDTWYMWEDIYDYGRDESLDSELVDSYEKRAERFWNRSTMIGRDIESRFGIPYNDLLNAWNDHRYSNVRIDYLITRLQKLM